MPLITDGDPASFGIHAAPQRGGGLEPSELLKFGVAMCARVGLGLGVFVNILWDGSTDCDRYVRKASIIQRPRQALKCFLPFCLVLIQVIHAVLVINGCGTVHDDSQKLI